MAIDRILERALVIGNLDQPQRTDRQGGHRADLAIADRRQFDAAAAKITGDAGGIGNACQHAERRQPAFFRPRQHAHANRKPLFDVVDEFGAILRIAHRGRRQHIDARGTGGTRQGDETLQIGFGEGDAFGIEPVGLFETATKAAHHLFVQQGARGAARRVINHQAKGIRTDIDDCDAIGLRGRFERRNGAAVRRHEPLISAWSFRRQAAAWSGAAARRCPGPKGWDWS